MVVKQADIFSRVKIIDDDIDLKSMRPLKEGEFDILLVGEDAPQIAGVVDERGPVDFSDKRRWKIITENEEGDLTISSHIINTEKQMWISETNAEPDKNDDADLSPPRSLSKHSKNKRLNLRPHKQSKHDDDSNSSPPRRPRNYDSDLSPPKKSKDNDSDLSPPRKSKDNDSDLSPPRSTKHRIAHATSRRNYHGSGNRGSDSDLSPPRQRKQNLDTDLYESRRSKKSHDSDLSESRRKEHRSRSDNSSRSSSRKTDREHDYSSRHSSRSSRHDVSR